MQNKLILSKINNLSIEVQSFEETRSFVLQSYKKINIKELESQIISACIELSNIGEECFGCDFELLYQENCKRLHLINQLLSNFKMLKEDIANINKNKMNCSFDQEYLEFSIYNIKNIIETLSHYDSFRKEFYE